MNCENTILFSVIVCTKDRPVALERCIKSILAGEEKKFELIIVDQSNSEKAESNKKCLPNDSRIVYLHMNEIGLAKARNYGIAHARGTIFALTDDDCTVPVCWLGKFEQCYNENPCIDMIMGSVCIGSKDTAVSKNLLLEDGEFKLSLQKRLIWGVGGNRTFKRTVFKQTGGMDEMLGVGGPIPGNEDSDFTYRCLRKRIRVFHLSSNQITHYPEEKSTKEDIIKKARGYCISNGARYIKYMRAGDCQSIFFLIANMASWYWDSLWILVRKQKFYRLPKWLFIPYFMLLITYWHINGICISFKYAVDSSTMKFKIRRCLKSESL